MLNCKPGRTETKFSVISHHSFNNHTMDLHMHYYEILWLPKTLILQLMLKSNYLISKV